jgi:Na+(H+)/acetate symporter ActP
MEKILRKSAFYGFLLGLGYAILFTKYKEVIDLGEGVSETTYFPVMDYVVTILRYGVWGAVVALLGAWLIGKRTKENEEAVKTYYLEVFLGIFVFCLIIGTLFSL